LEASEFFELEAILLFAEDLRVKGLLEFEQVPKDASELVSHGGDSFWRAEAGFKAAKEFTKVVIGAPEALSRQAKGLGDTAFDVASSDAVDLSAGDAVVGAKAEPTGKMFCGGEARGKVGAQFAEEEEDGGGLETRDIGEIHAQDAEAVFASGKLRFVTLGLAVAGLGSGQRCAAGVSAGVEGLKHGSDLEVAGGDEGLLLLPEFKGLLESEEMFDAPISAQTFGESVAGGLNARVFEGGEFEGVAFPGEDGLKDG